MELRITTQLASGNRREALALMAEAFADDIGRYCTSMTRSEAEAEELVQETFIQAFEALERYTGQSSVRAFLFGIARRVCIRHLRKRDRRRGLFQRWFVVGDSVVADPVDPVEAAEERVALATALAALKPTLREAVLLRYQAGLEGPEVARALGISHAAARKRVSLGVKALRESLRPVLMQPVDTNPSNHGERNESALSEPVSTRLGRS